MSSTLARTSLPLASRVVARQVVQQPMRRQPFSIASKLRQLSRSVEPHPFERLPVSQHAQGADWGREMRKIGGQAVL